MNSPVRSRLLNSLGLYMVTAEPPGRSHLDVAEAAIDGGATVIQFRDKSATSREMFACALALRELTQRRGAYLIVNDRIDIALAIKADGVHLGQDDFDIKIAREIMGDDVVIGISATSLGEAIEATKDGADYIGVGPIFPTPSKDDAANPMGLDGLRAVREASPLPIVAIGGITIDNSDDVIRSGADGIAVISAVASAPDMVEAARVLSHKIASAKRSG